MSKIFFKGKVTAVKYSDRTMEIAYHCGWFKNVDKINKRQTAENILALRLNPPTNIKNVFETVEIIIDDKKDFRIFLKIKDDIDEALNIEDTVILVGACVVFDKS